MILKIKKKIQTKKTELFPEILVSGLQNGNRIVNRTVLFLGVIYFDNIYTIIVLYYYILVDYITYYVMYLTLFCFNKNIQHSYTSRNIMDRAG